MRSFFLRAPAPSLLALIATLPVNAASPMPNPIWPRPTVSPRPDATAGAAAPLPSLAGKWQVNLAPEGEFLRLPADTPGWTHVQAPGDLRAIGLKIAQGREYAYLRPISVPADFGAGALWMIRREWEARP